ncbi:hypothetical protein TNCV_1484951 [Trichonephila clavipes]|nr:hypothetical protein TNCV_1484951 [Trichonephila clavipes]
MEPRSSLAANPYSISEVITIVFKAVFGPRGEHLSPAFSYGDKPLPQSWCGGMGGTLPTIHGHLALIRHTMTSQWYVHDHTTTFVPLMQRLTGHFFIKNMLANTVKVSQRSNTLQLPFLVLPDHQICLNREYPESFGILKLATPVVERTRDKVTANME